MRLCELLQRPIAAASVMIILMAVISNVLFSGGDLGRAKPLRLDGGHPAFNLKSSGDKALARATSWLRRHPRGGSLQLGIAKVC